MSKFKDLTKRKFGRLTVIKRVENDKNGYVRWLCECKCGNIVVIRSGDLRSGHTRSCGCLAVDATKERHTTHGMCGSPTYESWVSMIQRCTNRNKRRYEDYGARGITVCDKWLKFERFFEDMGKKPKGLTLERRDNDLGYCKENCCWDTPTAQARNQRIPKNNKTGIRGVHLRETSKKYIVSIGVNNKQIHVGRFVKLEQAAEARRQAELKYWG